MTTTINEYRAGLKAGARSEFLAIGDVIPGHEEALHQTLKRHMADSRTQQAVNQIGTLHEARFVLLDGDTRLMFASSFDGPWDVYIDDFATKIPDYMDILFTCFEGWPGIRSPEVKDFIARYQVPASAWYVANPNLTVAEARRLQNVGKALDDFLDRIG